MTYLKYLNIGCEIQFSQDFSLPGLLDFTAEEELGHKLFHGKELQAHTIIREKNKEPLPAKNKEQN